MVNSVIMFSENPSDDADTSHNRTMITVFVVALLLVAVMVAGVITWTNIQGQSADFRDDCRDLGGTPHDLGNEEICLIEDQVIGRQ